MLFLMDNIEKIQVEHEIGLFPQDQAAFGFRVDFFVYEMIIRKLKQIAKKE